ncbi:MAG: universal stress protein [Acidimicrobiales bacterium]|nr:universal stress protein [Acidimicrobiales bacterium]
MGRIVVGVDGSENGTAALNWAIDEVRHRDGPAAVEVVMAWHEPVTGGTVPAMVAIDIEQFEASYREHLDSIVGPVREANPDVEIKAYLGRGSASQVLLDAADGADLLVVGSRGHGGFIGLLLGSVSNQVVNHASCPVVVVPAPDA